MLQPGYGRGHLIVRVYQSLLVWVFDSVHDQVFMCTAHGVVKDNEKKMELMPCELKEANPYLIVHGCSSVMT